MATLHSSLTGLQLHNPKGVSPTPMLLPNALGGYLIQDEDGTNDFFRINTNNPANPIITFGGASMAPDEIGYRFDGNVAVDMAQLALQYIGTPPAWVVGDGTRAVLYSKDVSGVIELFGMSGDGTEYQLTGAAGSTGTISNTFTINTDALDSADESASLIFIASNENGLNDTLSRATLVVDAANERAYWTLERNLNSAGYLPRSMNLGIGNPGAASFNPILTFYNGTGAVQLNGVATHSIVSSRGYLTFTDARLVSRGTNSNSLVMGASANDTADNATVYGRSATAGDGSTALGGAATASGTASLCINAGGNALAPATVSGNNSIAIAAGANVSVTHTNCIVIGSAGTTTANDQVLIRGQSYVLGNGVTSTSPVSATIRMTTGVGGSSTNTNGGSLTFIAGIPTGSGNGGDLIFMTAPPGSSGTTLSTAVQRMKIEDTGEIIFSSTVIFEPNTTISTDARSYAKGGYVATPSTTPAGLIDLPASVTTGSGWADIWITASSDLALSSALVRHYYVRFENNAGTVSVVHSAADYDQTDAALSGVAVSIAGSGANVHVEVTGLSSTDIRWQARAVWGMVSQPS